jgi:hypothetical protein
MLDRTGSACYIEEMKYDGTGRLHEKKLIWPNASNMNIRYVYTYDRNNNVEMEDWYGNDGRLINQATYDYQVDRSDYIALAGPWNKHMENLFNQSSKKCLPATDKHGNWICRVMWSNGTSIIGMETRWFTYY